MRAEVPKMKLNNVYERKDGIAISVNHELNEAIQGYSYTVFKTPVTDIDTDV